MKHEFNADHYLIAFIDVLGQSNKILENSIYPPDEIAYKEIKRDLKETSEYITFLRELFQNHFKEYRKLKDVLNGLPEKQKKDEQLMRTFNAELRGVSDSIIVTVPLENKTDNCIPINNILATFQGICLVYNNAIAKQKPIRGGIDVGWGTRLSSNEVYGSGLVKAYTLESEEAKYPRVVIGKSLWEYINFVENHKTNTQYGKRANKLATQCKDLIVKYQKKYVLDVIGQGVKTSGLNIDSKLVETGYNYVVNSHLHYEEKGNSKLAPRYQLLRNYYESKIHLWGIKRKKR